MNKVLFLVLFAVSFSVLLGSYQDAHATDYTLSDAVSCQNLPTTGFGVWDDFNKKCSVQGTITITSSDTLIISPFVTLQLGRIDSTGVNAEPGQLDNSGVITVNGRIIVAPRPFSSSGTITNLNGGTINVNDDDGFNSNGAIINDGTINNNHGGTININDNSALLGNNQRLINDGTITNSAAGLGGIRSKFLQNNADGIITNSGLMFSGGGQQEGGSTLINNGVITNSGRFVNGSPSFGFFDTLTNTGIITITNSGTLENNNGVTFTNDGGSLTNNGAIIQSGTGTLNNKNSGTLTNNNSIQSGIINNQAVFIDAGTMDGNIITNSGAFTITNGGVLNIFSLTISSTGTLGNSGTITIPIGGTMTNDGTINNSVGGTISTSGALTITNNGTLNNSGTITIPSGGTMTNNGIFNNNSGGNLNIDGVLVNSSVILNAGTINNRCAGTINTTQAQSPTTMSSIIAVLSMVRYPEIQSTLFSAFRP